MTAKHSISDAMINVACRHAGLPFSAKTKGLRMYVRMGVDTLAIKQVIEDVPREIPTVDVIPLAIYMANLHYNGNGHGHLQIAEPGFELTDLSRTMNREKIREVYQAMHISTLRRWIEARELADALRCTDYIELVEEDMPTTAERRAYLDMLPKSAPWMEAHRLVDIRATVPTCDADLPTNGIPYCLTAMQYKKGE